MKYNPYQLFPENQLDIMDYMKEIGADVGGIHLMAPKAESLFIHLQNVSLIQANILKQEMLSKGGDAVVHKLVSTLKKDHSDVILIATLKQLREVIRKLKSQPFGLKRMAEELEEFLLSRERGKDVRSLDCRGKVLELGRKTLVMGIVNVTPDSFSDGGKYDDLERAVQHGKQLVLEGADILDIGGESTRPGHLPVPLEEEVRRVIPVIEALSKEVDVPISIDTYKAEVARKAVEAGAHLINDVWGCKADLSMAKTAAQLDVPIILMHNRETADYTNLIDDMVKDLRRSIQLALEAGIHKEKIIVDPGIGFGKTYEDNLEVMRRLEIFSSLGYPLLLGTSRKSMIGNTLHLPVDQRVEGTAATLVVGIMKGAQIVRVHDVKEMVRVCRMTDAMIRR
ncbi:dihydropteroate synthase [Microaerobacter geothermalis]|uniref:dihydropteroate synthase n=1 Tax=Microaerobacter geothermalis TaxID=674972 RepID=UPI001F162CED|nr:dihydropteroate synthase [Microaerobacter geothermalis]MCF6094675.1 dihydropteroate synthase [Microaerobacter geothermalis]